MNVMQGGNAYTSAQMAAIRQMLEAKEAVVLPIDMPLRQILHFFGLFCVIWFCRVVLRRKARP